MRWDKVEFGKVLKYEQPTKYIVESTNYDNSYSIPVLTAGKSFILGYTNEKNGVFDNVPVIIFDDFTTATKFVDFPFKVKSSAMKILKSDEEKAEIKYLFYLMKIMKVDSEQHKRYWISKYSKIKIPLPPLSTQKQIAEILDTADALRQKTQKQLEALNELAKSVFGEMFGDLGKNSKNWTEELIDDLVFGIVGGTSYGGEERTLNEDELGVLKISAVTSGEFRPIFKAVKKNILKKELVTPKEGDILFSRANTRELVAATCIVDKDYDWLFLPDKLWRIDLKKNKVNNYFFQFVLSDKKYRNKLTKKATGTSGSMLNISKKKLRNTLFPVPPLILQDQFSEIIKNINRQKQQIKEALKESEDLFNALLQEVFQ